MSPDPLRPLDGGPRRPGPRLHRLLSVTPRTPRRPAGPQRAPRRSHRCEAPSGRGCAPGLGGAVLLRPREGGPGSPRARAREPWDPHGPPSLGR